MDGFALLGSHLGDPDRKILTAAQIRTLTERMETLEYKEQDRELCLEDLWKLGYGRGMSERILMLLSEKDQLSAYLQEAEHQGCSLLTRGDEDYPVLVRRRLGGESPCCFFCKGDVDLLRTPGVALVGSRELNPQNRAFAREAGRQAAIHGLTLISGNARGADRAAQDACLEAGGQVVSIVADSLQERKREERVLYLSLQDFDAPFSSARAHSRNNVIHSLGLMTLVSQCSLGTGGTWTGTTRNLHSGWSLVACFRDGSPASLELQNQGAYLIGIEDLDRLTDFRDPQMSLFL